MGGGYTEGTPKVHTENLWPLILHILAKIDLARATGLLVHHDYADWSKKGDPTAADSVVRTCRDSVQWMASWCGAHYADSQVAVHYIAFSTICDDICVPPLDMVGERFRIYGRSVRDVVAMMEDEGWHRDSTHALLSLLRQYIVQYLEKVDCEISPGCVGLHAELNRSDDVWDSIVYRTHTANTYGSSIMVGRVGEAGPLTYAWLMDGAICDGISMDLCKFALGIYSQDDHQPTANVSRSQRRQAAYHSVYLDLIDDLVFSGAHDAIVHYGRSGFLFVPIQDRYQERREGRRFPIRPAMAERLLSIFGEVPTDAWLERRFHQRWMPGGLGALDVGRPEFDSPLADEQAFAYDVSAGQSRVGPAGDVAR